jgi:hypothetical protein
MARLRFAGLWILVAAFGLGLSGCSCGGDDEGDRISSNYNDKEKKKDAGDQNGDDESSDDTALADANPSTPEPVDPVKFDKLLPYLPASCDCQAGEAKGSTTAMPGYKMTVVSNRYQCAGEPQGSIDVDITDGGYAQMVTAPFQMMSQMSTETTEGYQKGVTIDDHPGYATWNKASRYSELTVLVGNRFLVALKGSNIDPETLQKCLETIDLDELADLS